MDNFFEFRKNNKKIVVNNDFKDFISINQFCAIIRKIINLIIYLSQKKYIYQKQLNGQTEIFKKKLSFGNQTKILLLFQIQNFLRKLELE